MTYQASKKTDFTVDLLWWGSPRLTPIKVFLCIEELARHKVIKLASFVLTCHQCVKSVTNGHFVSHDLFMYYLNPLGKTSQMAVKKLIVLLASKEMATRTKKLLIWMVPLHFEYHRLLLPMVLFHYKFNDE